MATDALSIPLDELKQHPHRIAELTTTEKFSFDADTLSELQLAGLRTSFAAMIDDLPVLQRFAEEQGVTEIRSIEDGALLLFPHTLYKSYPLSAIENARFDMLSRWLSTLTTIDVSHIDASACASIDDWLALLDAETEIRIKHSSGTTGKLSFIPGNLTEAPTTAITFRRYLQGFGDEPDAGVEDVSDLPMVSFAARQGAMAAARQINAIVAHVYGGDESMVYPTNPGRISADMLSLGGRLEGAANKGELGQVQLAPGLLERREEFLRQQAEAPKRLEEFFERVASELKGRKVILNGILPAEVETAVAGLQKGYEGLFAPDSLFVAVGGTKGRAFPADYREQVERFTGVPFPRTGYGMSEGVSAVTRMCPAGYYHVNPNIVSYLLDPDSGAPLPRTGTQTGRYGFIDIACRKRWGGFLSGDELTIHWGDEKPCSCGRKGAYSEPNIRRYSESEGGDDKITCAGATGVHDQALALIADTIA